MDVEQHRHCQICGKAIPMKREFCSKRCKSSYQAMMKKRKLLINIMYAMMFFFLAMMFMGLAG